MRFGSNRSRLRRGFLVVAGFALVSLLLVASRSGLAQTGSGSLTLVKQANPPDGTDFTLAPTLIPLGSFGSSGSAAGQFVGPEGIAVAADGSVYVADFGNSRIQQFDAAGNFVRAWGWGVAGGTGSEICNSPATCQAGVPGDGAGQFSNQYGVAVAAGPPAAVYVVDSGNHRVQQFDAAGNFVRAWGWGVAGGTGFEICSTPAACRAGVPGDEAGQFADPIGLAVGPDGAVYVGDYNNHRIQQFTAAGLFVRAWGWGVVNGAPTLQTCTDPCQAGLIGDGAGQFENPNGLAVGQGPGGVYSVYVADLGNDRVQQFTTSGSFVRTWGWGVTNGADQFQICTGPCRSGDFGDGAGQFDFPYNLAVGPDGSVYVGDYNNHRIQQFTSTGDFVRAWGWGVRTGAAAFEVCTDTCLAAAPGNNLGRFHGANGVAVGPDGTLYATDYNNDRVQRFLVGPFLLDVAPVDDGDLYTHTTTIDGLPAGDYAFAETSPIHWTLGSVTCSGGTSLHSGRAFTVTVGAGADVNCTLINIPVTQTLTVDAVVVGGGPLSADDFSLFINVDGVDLGVGRGAANPVAAGIYTVTATSDPRYISTFGGACNASGVTTLGIGQHLTCIVTNTYITQTLTVNKAVVGGGPLSADDFPLFIDGSPVTRGVANPLEDGTYTVSETGSADYTASFSGACDDAGSVTLGIGDHAVCTLVNAYITPTLTVQKIVLGGGPLGADDFPLFINGSPVARGTENLLLPGTYTVTETSHPDYIAFFGGACDDAGRVTLAASQHVTCTITNGYITPTLTIEKVVVGGPLGADDFDLFIDGSPATRGVPVRLDGGTYTVSETSHPDYSASIGGACDVDGRVTLAAGQHLTCVITNTYTTPTLTVEKVVVGGPLGADDFDLFIDGNQVGRGAANDVAAGAHIVSEAGDPRYVATFGGACDAAGNVTLAAGQHLTCTITNTYTGEIPTQTLTVNKIVIGGPLNADSFPLFIDDDRVARGVANSLAAGIYTVSEMSASNYTASFSGACGEAGVVILGVGQNLVCTITNTYEEPGGEPEMYYFLPSISR